MEVVGGIPVECLTAGELAGVWSGWSSMGDREVVREASVKGTHIDLAHKFLAYRRHWCIGDAKKYFDSEVEVWINELLRKRTIHRASHILKNVGRDPIKYIHDICAQCTEPELRDYLAQHVTSRNGFTSDEIEAWELLKCMEKHGEEIRLSNDTLDGHSIQDISIEKMINLPTSIKSPLISELYFCTYEPCLFEKLDSNTVWDYLLTAEKVELIKNWIDRKYDITDKKSEMDKIFERLEITEDMLEKIEQSNVSVPTKEILLNQLVKYAIFTGKESNDVKATLARFFNAEIPPSKFITILSKDSCNIDAEKFFQSLHSIFYYQNEKNVDQSLLISDKKLLDTFNGLNKHGLFDQKILSYCIFQMIYKLTDQISDYLEVNPFITLYLILLEFSNTQKEPEYTGNSTKKLDFRGMTKNENGIAVDEFIIPHRVVEEMLKKIPLLGESIEEALKVNDVTMYQLLNGYQNVDTQELFKWRYRNEIIPNFSSEKMIKKYGHKEKLTYKYYLKEARPSMAAYILHNMHHKKQTRLSSKMKLKIASQVHILGLKHVNTPEIISTCIAFIEFLGADSEYLRLHATAADYVRSKVNISINDLLESITCCSQKDLATIITHLEYSFQAEFKGISMDNVEEFVSALKSWDFIVRFAKAHNSRLPAYFLEMLAENNLWFEFVLVVHIFRYSLEQILDNARKFSHCTVREHLLICLNNFHLVMCDFPCNPQRSKKRVARNSNYLRMNPKSNNSSSSSPTQTDMKPLKNSIQNNQCFQLHRRNLPFDHDHWLTILKCHQSQDPPGALIKESRRRKSPILIVLASCYEPSSIAAYCYSWLVVSVQNEDLMSNYAACLNDQVWSARRISELFRRIVALGFVETLSRGLEIFMPENPLSSFSKFLVQCIKLGNFENSKEYLWEFLSMCSELKSNKMINWEDSEITYLSNEFWTATVAIELVITALGTCFQSTHLQKRFLNILVDDNFNDELNIHEPDLCSLLQIITSLSKTSIKMKFAEIKLTENGINLTEEVERCIQELMENENFSVALELSKTANLPCSSIILNQYRSGFQRNYCENKMTLDRSFWEKCAQDMRKYDVGFEDAATFFIEHAEKVASHKERYEILELALETLKTIETDQQTIDMVEMAMWKSCILAGPNLITIQNDRRQFNSSRTELLSSVSNLRVSCSLYDSTEEKAVETLIDMFIDAEDLETALRISAIFNYKHKDLQMLMLCLSLAEGEISPYQLNSQQKILMAQTENIRHQKYSTLKNRGLQKRLSTSSLNSLLANSSSDASDAVASSNYMIQRMQMDCTNLLEKLVKNLQHGLSVGNKVLLLYKLSTNLKKNYRSLLIEKDSMGILYELTGINCIEKFDLMRDVISSYRIKNTEIAKFLAREIHMHVLRQVEDGSEDSMLMWGCPLDLSLHLITDLCSDTSVLAWELLKSASLMLGHSIGTKPYISALKIVVELLVRSHDYFTASCSMEGIASVLRKCQQLANVLQQLKLWSVLVRLVTGVGRFTEMNYIFQILKENDQFEFLLGQGMDKILGLKIAVLEFCKKQCPDDKELFKLVALHFRLYNEIAIMWESEGKIVIRELIKETRKDIKSINIAQNIIKFTKNDSTETKLRLSVANFTHATEYYLQDNKLNLANRCSHQAQLVALQISMLNGVAPNQQVDCLLNLSIDEVNRALCNVLTFPQALIFVQAYNHNADWSSALYHHVILNGETKYLKDFLMARRLTTTIVRDCTCRYRMEKHVSKQMIINMKSLITELNDVECKYVLASQLGFKDVIEMILSNVTTGSYLKDTVWKQGFKPQEFIGETFRG